MPKFLRNTLIFLFLSSIFTSNLNSQILNNIEHFNFKDGLSNNYVLDITEGNGYIWFATESGLNRFDGYSFTTYRNVNTNIKEDAINCLFFEEEDNCLWIGSKLGGLSMLDCSNYTFHNFDLFKTGVTGIVKATDEGLWISPPTGPIFYYSKQNKNFSSISHWGIRGTEPLKNCMLADKKGNLLIGYRRDGFKIINLTTKEVESFQYTPNNPNSLPDNNIHVIYQDQKGNIWIGTHNGLALFNPLLKTFTTFKHDTNNPNSLLSNAIFDIKEINDNKLWIATDIGGISILDLNEIAFKNPKEVKFKNIDTQDGLSSLNIRNLLQDSYGNIWIGNYGYGIDLVKHKPTIFKTLLLNQKPQSTWGIQTDHNNTVWVGGENELYAFKHNQFVKKYDLAKHMFKTFGQIFSIYNTGNNELLLGTYNNGLLKLNTKTEQVTRINLDAPDENVLTFLRLKNGLLLIGTQYGIYTYNNQQLTKNQIINQKIKGQSVYAIIQDKQEKLWVGSYSDGITIFDKDNNYVCKIETKDGLCSNAINSMHIDNKGEIWIATRNGIAHIPNTSKPNEIKCYGYEHGLKDIFVRAIISDKNNNIWLSSNNSISLWDKQKQCFYNYDYKDGIPTGNFIEGSVCQTSDGTIYFGSLNGCCYFNPEQITTNEKTSKVQITECENISNSYNTKYSSYIPQGNDKIKLDYKQNSIKISFNVADFSQCQQVEYTYKIDGLTQEWMSTQGENYVILHNLNPGKYVFKIKAKLKNMAWDENNIATISLFINPPIWSTWYAKLLYILCIIILIYGFIRFYIHKMTLENSLELEKKQHQNEQELNNERLRFYTNITHELRTPLTLIIGPLEDLSSDTQLPTLYHEKVASIYNSALRLLNLINQLLEFRKTETQNRKLTVTKENLGNLVTEIGLRYKELNRNENVRYVIHVEQNIPLLYFDIDIITTILNNLLNNAVKYTPSGTICLTLNRIQIDAMDYVEIKVADTGYGIDKQALPHIFKRYYQAEGKHQASGTGIGLALVKSLADLHEGLLQVDSEIGKGSTFSFAIQVNNSYPTALHKESTNTEQVSLVEEKEQIPLLLIVEDNDDIRDYVISSFKDTYRTLSANNGKDGLEIALKQIPDLIISDIMMPVMNGIDMCKKIKEDMRTSHIPIILLTAKDSIENKEEGYDSGADSYLTKPFSAKLLKIRVHNLLESRKQLAKHIIEKMKGNKSNPIENSSSNTLGRLDDIFLKRFTNIVEANIDKNILDMPFIADKMHISHSTLYRKIKALTGMSGNELIRKIKLKNSLRLLIEEGYNVSEAAYSSGFNDLGYFRNCFKEEYGMLPSEYIRQKKI